MIDWKQKLSSRKFWVAVIGFVTALLYAFNIAEADIEKVASIITAGSTLVIYILVEGSIDKQRAQAPNIEVLIDKAIEEVVSK